MSELKFDCECRKLKLDMLLKAAEDFNISLVDSWMIGDSDVLVGKVTGCPDIKVVQSGLIDAVKDILCRENTRWLK